MSELMFSGELLVWFIGGLASPTAVGDTPEPTPAQAVPVDVDSAQPRPSEPAFVPRFRTVLLAADGFSLEEVAQAFQLRAPDLLVLTQWDASTVASAPGQVFVAVRRGTDAARIEIVTPEGDGYLRDVPHGDRSLRGTIAAVFSLLVSIEADALVADVGVQRMPETNEPEELDALRRRVDAALDVASPVPDLSTPTASAPVSEAEPFVVRAAKQPAPARERERHYWGLAVGPAVQVHAGPPRFADPYDGVGIAARASFRGRRHVAIDFGGRWLSREPGMYRIHRIRVAGGIGYEFYWSRWRLPVLAEVAVEPWWVAAPSGGRVTPADLGLATSAASLFGAAVAARPAYEFAVLGSSVDAVRIGLSLHAGASFGFDDGPVSVGVAVDENDATEIARLGGLEFGAMVETTVLFGRK